MTKTIAGGPGWPPGRPRKRPLTSLDGVVNSMIAGGANHMPRGRSGGGARSGGGGDGKTVLGAKAKERVQTLKDIGVEDPRKFFLAGKDAGMNFQNIKGAAKTYAAGDTGPRLERIYAQSDI